MVTKDPRFKSDKTKANWRSEGKNMKVNDSLMNLIALGDDLYNS